MYLTIHAAAGALIGSYINQSFIAFIVGVLSHLFLDMLPHTDGNIPTKDTTAKILRKLYFRKIVSLVYFDICLSIIIAAALFTNNAHFLTRPIIWGIVGSILPDIFQALSFFWQKNRFLQKFNDFHGFIHYSPQKQLSQFMGHLTQLVTLIIIINPLI